MKKYTYEDTVPGLTPVIWIPSVLLTYSKNIALIFQFLKSVQSLPADMTLQSMPVKCCVPHCPLDCVRRAWTQQEHIFNVPFLALLLYFKSTQTDNVRAALWASFQRECFTPYWNKREIRAVLNAGIIPRMFVQTTYLLFWVLFISVCIFTDDFNLSCNGLSL